MYLSSHTHLLFKTAYYKSGGVLDMLDICFISLFTVFCTMGIYFFVKEVTSALLKNHIKTKILLEVHNSDIDIEGQIRSIISANPESDILISDKSENDEISMILHKMSADNSCIILDNVKSSQK